MRKVSDLVREQNPLMLPARAMQDARCRHLPIVHDGKVVGIVSRGDFRGIERDRLDEETCLWERIA